MLERAGRGHVRRDSLMTRVIQKGRVFLQTGATENQVEQLLVGVGGFVFFEDLIVEVDLEV